MPNLVFIRHSQTQPDPNVPARLWSLTDEGRRRCGTLAEQLTPYNLDIIVTSTEAKAVETGELVAQKLEIPCRMMENLHEHERESGPYFDTKEEFLAAIATFFSRTDELIFGDETAFQAQKRFTGAVESILIAYPQENIAIVTHGTVLSLFASQYIEQEIYPLWQSLGLPAIVAFSYPEIKLLAQVIEIV